MTTITHSTYAALVRACAAQHGDDMPRLALADHLEENGDEARAELIRVQCELARWPVIRQPHCLYGIDYVGPLDGHDAKLGHPCPRCNPDSIPVVAREQELLREHEARWRRGGKCQNCDGGWKNDAAIPVIETEYKCPTCHGTGWSRWWLAASVRSDHDGTVLEWRHRVHFVRGFPEQVDCNLDDIFRDNRPTEWAMQVVRSEQCGRRFGVVDKVPGHWPGGEGDRAGYWWEPGISFDAPRQIPFSLGRFGVEQRIWKVAFHGGLMIYVPIREKPSSAGWDSPAAANRALAEAAWRVVKEKA